MKVMVSARGNRNEWDYGFETEPYEPQSLSIESVELPNHDVLHHIHQHHHTGCKYGSISVSSDRGAKLTVKAFYTVLREIAAEKNWQNFNLYAQTILEKRYGGFWRVYARI